MTIIRGCYCACAIFYLMACMLRYISVCGRMLSVCCTYGVLYRLVLGYVLYFNSYSQGCFLLPLVYPVCMQHTNKIIVRSWDLSLHITMHILISLVNLMMASSQNLLLNKHWNKHLLCLTWFSVFPFLHVTGVSRVCWLLDDQRLCPKHCTLLVIWLYPVYSMLQHCCSKSYSVFHSSHK
jgi:hypothetical protein